MLVVIHGFNSAGTGDKATRLRASLPHIEVVSPTLSYVPDKAMAELTKIINKGMKRKKPIVLLGSSLGAFYGAYLAKAHALPLIMINPLVDHRVLEGYIGVQKNYYTGKAYDWSQSLCDQLSRYTIQPAELPVQPLLLLDEGDELLGHWQAQKHYGPFADVRLYPDGSHRFDHLAEALPAIRKYLEGRC